MPENAPPNQPPKPSPPTPPAPPTPPSPPEQPPRPADPPGVETSNRMSIRQRYELMHAVKTKHGFGLTDSEFAEQMSRELGFRVQPATVASYRDAFDIAPIKSASAAELRARVRELEARLASQSAAPRTT